MLARDGRPLIWGVGVVRNEADIVELCLRHHSYQGVDRFLILDNDSTDGTRAILDQLARELPVECRSYSGAFEQHELLTALAREAFVRGADWVLPIDADEFWVAPGTTLRSVLVETRADALCVDVINFIQERGVVSASPTALLTMTRRVASPSGTPETIASLVSSNEIAFVEHRYMPKWVSRASATLSIDWGNHDVSGVVGERVRTDAIVCLHAPLRCMDALVRKVDGVRPSRELDPYLERAWHVRRWRQLAEAGALGDEWRANSYLNDSLDVYGSQHPVIVDTRLRDVLQPWFRSFAEPPDGVPRATTQSGLCVEWPAGSRLWAIVVLSADEPLAADYTAALFGSGVAHILILDARREKSSTSGEAVRLEQHASVEWRPLVAGESVGMALSEISREAWQRGADWVVALRAGEVLHSRPEIASAPVAVDSSLGVVVHTARTTTASPAASRTVWLCRATPYLRYNDRGEVVGGWSGPVGAANAETAVSIGHHADPNDRRTALRLSPSERESILAQMELVPGWLTRAEGSRLLEAVEHVAHQLPSRDVVEVGSYYGRSTSVLAATLARLAPGTCVYSIDPHEGELGAADASIGLEVVGASWRALCYTLERFDLSRAVRPLRCHSFHVDWTRPIGLLFIDGLHDRDSVWCDVDRFIGSVVPGGLIAFHDCTDLFPGVVGAVEELLACNLATHHARGDSIVVLQRTSVPYVRSDLPDGSGQDGSGESSSGAVVANLLWRVARAEGSGRVLAQRARAFRSALSELSGTATTGMGERWDAELLATRNETAALNMKLADAERMREALLNLLDRKADRELVAAERAMAQKRRVTTLELQLAKLEHEMSIAVAQTEAHARARAMAEEYAASLAGEIDAFRRSWSWRITTPARRMLDVVHTLRRPEAPGAPHGSGPSELAVDPNDHAQPRAATSTAASSRCLVILDQVPTPDMDSGSYRICQIIRLIVEMGHALTLAIDSDSLDDAGRAALRGSAASDVVTGRGAVVSLLKSEGPAYRHVYLSRPDLALIYLIPVRAYAPQARVIYDTVDLHGVRLGRQFDVTRDPSVAALAERYKSIEMFVASGSDVTLTVSEDERRWLLERDPRLQVEILSNVHPPHPAGESWTTRSGLLFIGGFWHQPNEDAMCYFVEEILPLVRQSLPDVTLSILGSHMSPRVEGLRSAGVDCIGYVEDPIPYFQHARVFVAPLRFGAGVKGKVGQSMSHGLPVVTTTIGAEGLGLVSGETALVADTPETFAGAVVSLYTDRQLWESIAASSVVHIDRVCGIGTAREALGRIVPIGGRA